MSIEGTFDRSQWECRPYRGIGISPAMVLRRGVEKFFPGGWAAYERRKKKAPSRTTENLPLLAPRAKTPADKAREALLDSTVKHFKTPRVAIVQGLCLKWNEQSPDCIWNANRADPIFQEEFRQGCFAVQLEGRPAILCCHNHMLEVELGSTTNGSFFVEERSGGLWVELHLPENHSILRQKINGWSIRFKTHAEQGRNRRKIRQAALCEISILTGQCVPAHRTSWEVKFMPEPAAYVQRFKRCANWYGFQDQMWCVHRTLDLECAVSTAV